KFVVGYAQEKQFHENADKLTVCQVDVGDETLQIVCGAPNVEQGQKVVVAKVGATMPSGMKIKQTKLRGVSSYGMICSKRELRSEEHTSELQSRFDLVCRLLLEKKKIRKCTVRTQT